MDIDSNCPSLLFGETTSHLTSKWRGTFQYLFNVENSIKREMRKWRGTFQFLFNVENSIKREMRKKYPQPPPPPFFTPNYFFYVGNSMKRDENLKYWKENKEKNSYKIQTTFHQYQKLYSTPPWHGARTYKVSRKDINVLLSSSAKTKRDGQTDRRGALQYLPSRAFGAAGDKKYEYLMKKITFESYTCITMIF